MHVTTGSEIINEIAMNLHSVPATVNKDRSMSKGAVLAKSVLTSRRLVSWLLRKLIGDLLLQYASAKDYEVGGCETPLHFPQP